MNKHTEQNIEFYTNEEFLGIFSFLFFGSKFNFFGFLIFVLHMYFVFVMETSDKTAAPFFSEGGVGGGG